MDKPKNLFALGKIGKALQLKFPELGALTESLKYISTEYDFFRMLALHIIPLIRKSPSFKRLTNRWERELQSSKKELEKLKNKAIEEVTSAFKTKVQIGVFGKAYKSHPVAKISEINVFSNITYFSFSVRRV